jgi:hypothetical protein
MLKPWFFTAHREEFASPSCRSAGRRESPWCQDYTYLTNSAIKTKYVICSNDTGWEFLISGENFAGRR